MVGASGCDRSGVATIAVFVTGESTLGTDLRTYSCDDGAALLTGLPPGTYDLSLRGRDADGVDRFGGEVLGVVISSNETTNVQTVRLSALPAELRVTWYFENGRMCSYNGVEQVEIILFEDEYEIYSVDASCSAGVVDLTDLQADTYIVDIVAVDADRRVRFNGQEEIQVDRGDRSEVEIRLLSIDSPPAVRAESE